jgi:RNA polymerase sigma factor (sigma-70 family)
VICDVIDWSTIVAEHGPAVWRTVYRLVSDREDANDCYQETFLRAARFASKRTVSNWGALLQRMAAGRALDCLRRRYRDVVSVPLEAAADFPDRGVLPSAQIELHETVERLRRGVASLPSQHAVVFWLREVELMSTAEVADALQITPDQVATGLYRAKQKLREALTERDPNRNDSQSEVRR